MITNSHKINHRYNNGTYIGMLKEVQDEIVDTSTGGFFWTLDRDQRVDFTPNIDFKTEMTLVVKRPSNNELSLKYFTIGK